MTATTPSKIVTDDLSVSTELDESVDLDQLPDTSRDTDPARSYERTRGEAEFLLALVAEACQLKHGDLLANVPVERLAVIAAAGAGFAQLAAIDWAAQRANQHAMPAADEPADFLIDKTDDRWTHTGNGLYESKQDPGLFDVPIDQIRAQWGPVREFVLRPPRPAG